MYFKHLHDNRERVQREMMTRNVHRNRRITANRSHGIVHANRRCAMRCNAMPANPVSLTPPTLLTDHTAKGSCIQKKMQTRALTVQSMPAEI